MKRFIKSWLINTAAVLVAVYIVPGIHFVDNSWFTPFIAALVLGILNAIIRPVLMLLALPLLIFTLGLFTLVINAFLLYSVGFLLSNHFRVETFWSAFLGALIISLVSAFLNAVTGTPKTKVRFERRRRPPDAGSGGNGPVIDI